VIRTREGWIRPLTAFEAVPFVRSGTPPSASLATCPEWLDPARRGTMSREVRVEGHELAGLPIFSTLSKKELKRVGRWADEVDLPEGYHLLEEGAFPYEFYVILEGAVGVTKDGRELATLGRGEMIGEIAILEDDRRTATVVAMSPVRAAVMTRRDFDAMRNELPEVAAQIEATARERLTR
jgi:CRP/FNR family transcriptional regulator, cyclic AMP receptor protein